MCFFPQEFVVWLDIKRCDLKFERWEGWRTSLQHVDEEENRNIGTKTQRLNLLSCDELQ